MPRDFPLLLIAQSARMMAESAARGGFRCAAIDLFGDEDTRQAAENCMAMGFGKVQQLVTAAERMIPADGRSAFIYGSGIDSHPDIVESLSQRYVCLGNAPSTLRLFNDPAAFFALLTELAIPFPVTRGTAPESFEGWLLKRGCGEGGKGVGFLAENRPLGPGEYCQRHIAGAAHSALFLTNGRNARIIGFNTLWVNDGDPAQPFLFAGAVNRADLTRGQVAMINAYISRLAAESGLVGLNSLDFMIDGEIRVLEVNPRPSASMALYDEDWPDGLLAAHVDACRGILPQALPAAVPVRAFRVVTAPRELHIAHTVDWPHWCADRPMRGSTVAAGQPLCTVKAEAGGRREVEAMLRARESELLASLSSPERDAAPASIY